MNYASIILYFVALFLRCYFFFNAKHYYGFYNQKMINYTMVTYAGFFDFFFFAITTIFSTFGGEFVLHCIFRVFILVVVGIVYRGDISLFVFEFLPLVLVMKTYMKKKENVLAL